MSVSAVQMLHGILWNSTLISQLSNARMNTGISHLLTHGSGAPQPIFSGIAKLEPMIPIDTTQVKSILDITGPTIATQTNVDLYHRVATSSGERTAAATTAHYRKRCAEAVMVPGQLSARDGQEANITGAVHILYDGTNEPVVPAGSVALSGTPSSAEHYTTGPLKINGTAIDGVQDISIDFGIRIHKLFADGDVYPTFITVAQFSPVITVSVLTDSWSTIGLTGISDDAVVFLRQITATGRAANSATTAIGFTVASAKITIDETSGTMADPSMTTIRISPLSSDGTTAPIVIDTTMDIT
jgi:hypothetical protein